MNVIALIFSGVCLFNCAVSVLINGMSTDTDILFIASLYFANKAFEKRRE